MRWPVTPLLTALVAGALAGSVTAREPREAVPPATPTGPPVNCIPLRAIVESQVRDDRTIDFYTRVGRAKGYRVVLPQACPELGFEQRFGYVTSLNQLCASDIITVLHETPIGRGASCGLAPFQPVTFPRRR